MSIWQIIRRLYPLSDLTALGDPLAGAHAFGAFRGASQSDRFALHGRHHRRTSREGKTAGEGGSLCCSSAQFSSAKKSLTRTEVRAESLRRKSAVNVSSRLSHSRSKKSSPTNSHSSADADNQTGILQTRIDRGVESLTKIVQSTFIDILPLFANAIMALIVMFYANFYVGLTAAAILPVYFLLSYRQALMLKGARRGLRALREEKNNGLHNIIESLFLKSFVCEGTRGRNSSSAAEPSTRAQAKADPTRFRRTENIVAQIASCDYHS